MDTIVLEMSTIIISTAVLCVIAEIAKQPLIVAYIFAGFLVGPAGLGLIQGNGFFSAISQIGVILLLYLIGLELRPRKFADTLKKTSLPAIFATLTIVPFGVFIGWVSGLSPMETTYLTAAFLFSSTVVVLRMMSEDGDVDKQVFDSSVGMLIIQDIIAVFVLVFMSSQGTNTNGYLNILIYMLYGLFIILLAYFLQRYLLRRIIKKILHRTDLVFLLGLAWCFLFAELSETLGLSREIGGFIAGLSLTCLPAHKLRVFIYKSETIRDFFMILFFFILGAELELTAIGSHSLLITLSLIFIILGKPLIYFLYMRLFKHPKSESKEVSFRLGQISEFSIIIALLGVSLGHISDEFSMSIRLLLFASIIFSNYIVRYLPIRKAWGASLSDSPGILGKIIPGKKK
jgi:Kef-type K+ transport system membrane component KefB